MRMRMVLVACLVSGGALAATATDRREMLAQVQELLRDPDPMMRLANMEEILASGDGLRIQIALKAAFSSNDADMRGLAMRSYIANLKRVTFDVQPTDAAAKAYAAANDEPVPLAEVFKRYPFMKALAGVGFQLILTFKDYEPGSNTGTVTGANNAPFTITGDRFTTRLYVALYGNYECNLELRPSGALRLEGTISCTSDPIWPRLRISAPLF